MAKTGKPANFLDERLPVRFWEKVQPCPISGCWLWAGAASDGYGMYRDRSYHSVGAHRWSYLRLVGNIESGLQLDHLCVVPLCVNPHHMEPVTHAENNHRAKARRASQKEANKVQKG